MASVYEIVRNIARAGATAPVLRGIVARKAAPLVADSGGTGFATLVESEIIPRLVVAHRHEPDARSCKVRESAHISAQEAALFAPHALLEDACTLLDRVELFLARGVSVDTLFVELLAPAARYLGTMWEEDTADFVAVTMALWRLQEIVRELSARETSAPRDEHCGRVLFSVMPGEDHSFGTVLVEDVFRRAGWSTTLLTQCNTSQLLATVANDCYDIVGLTVTSEQHCGNVPAVIMGLRNVSRNPNVSVMLGGFAFADQSERALQLGADATAVDATSALAVARDLVNGPAAQRRAFA